MPGKAGVGAGQVRCRTVLAASCTTTIEMLRRLKTARSRGFPEQPPMKDNNTRALVTRLFQGRNAPAQGLFWDYDLVFPSSECGRLCMGDTGSRYSSAPRLLKRCLSEKRIAHRHFGCYAIIDSATYESACRRAGNVSPFGERSSGSLTIAVFGAGTKP